MSDDLSPRLNLPFLAAGQAQKEIWVNEALQRLDALVQPVVQSASLATPPGAPDVGACWIVATGGTGAWAGRDGAIAQWTAGGWRFASPAEGWECRVIDRGAPMFFYAGEWQDGPVRPDGLYIDGVKLVGSRMSDIDGPVGGTIVDEEARMVINALLAVLRGHGLIGS